MSITDQLNYIMDGNGNYYRIDGQNQLVVADDRENAGIFSFFEANQRIGGGKRSRFYSIIPVESEAWEEQWLQEAEARQQESRKGMQEVAPKQESEKAAPKQESEEAASKQHAEEVASKRQEAQQKVQEMQQKVRGKLRSADECAQVYDLNSLDWMEYLTHFCYLVSGISNYRDELNRALSELDLQICDLVHYVELYEMEPDDCVRVTRLLKECREQRRDVKDEMYRVDCFQKTIGSSTNLARVKDSLKQIKKLESRDYHPRRLQKLFENCKNKTSRKSKLMRVFEEETCMDAMCEENMQEENGRSAICERSADEKEMNRISEENAQGKDNVKVTGRLIMQAGAGESVDCREAATEDSVRKDVTGADAGMVRRETVFDGKINDWGQFARQQAEFYENAEQYMYNLELDLEELDEKMEDILCEMEKENYNAAQGYQVFKELQELRRERSAKQRELECMQILTEGIDCGILAADMQYCVDEIEEVMGK